jgi:F-type H+-transporting ATPase subunit b
MFLTVDGTVVIQLINFVIFFAILNVVFLRPIGKAIRERRAYIDGVKRETEQSTTEARRLRAEAEQQRATARRSALEHFTAARGEAIDEADRLAREHAAAAAGVADEARATVELELEAARLRQDELASDLGKTLLDRALGALTR